MSIDAIVAEVENHPAAHVVLTGGEPMVARGIHELAARLRASGKHITIETAGTIAPGGIACDLASISPKLANSTPLPGTIEPAWIERHERSRLRPDILREWLGNYSYQLKFVVASETDLAEIESLLAGTGLAIPPAKVLLMPEGTDPATLDARRAMLVDLCLRKGHRLCDRLHIRLFGNTRGT
jgi:7-carboxy-7-deazaguanine synthase